MNKRIRQLMAQATLSAHRSQGYNGEPTHIYPGTLDPEKFAELLIQKCADIGERYADGNYEIRNQILIHFGLEEPEE